eukprot:3134859-Pyramimonas_sp.AAC.1
MGTHVRPPRRPARLQRSTGGQFFWGHECDVDPWADLGTHVAPVPELSDDQWHLDFDYCEELVRGRKDSMPGPDGI